MALIFTNDVAGAIADFVERTKPSDIFVHCDTNTSKFVMPILESQSEIVRNAKKIISLSGDVNKGVDALVNIWKNLSDNEATRSGLFINLGGGMVTDLGGFAAATFKRGMSILNIPTTLLGAVDASVGGKTGINFNGFKNQVGAFYNADRTIISTLFFETLTPYDMLSGYAEMIKHALLKDSKTFADVMAYDITLPPKKPDTLLNLLSESVMVKQQYAAADPTEKGLRKALNLGHTVGHAFEAFAMNDRKSPVSHGFAVAQGLVVEAILSNMIEGLDSSILNTLATYVRDNYRPYMITCDDYPRLIEYMRQDKKNDTPDAINFTLLAAPGDVKINSTVPEDKIRAALDIYRDLMGL